jgi:GTPase involved in cell partitioning and DNA repair
MTKKSNQFSVFGTRPDNAICLPDIPYSVRLNCKDGGMGIFTLGFNREVGENGVYYTISFDWKERETEAEKEQLNLIATFMSAYKEQLIDIEATRDLTRVDGWTAQQLQTLTETRSSLTGSSNRSLPAA